MQITTFNPMILSPKADEVIKLFEDLGFEKRHSSVSRTGKTGAAGSERRTGVGAAETDKRGKRAASQRG